jgi:hypothetical protein
MNVEVNSLRDRPAKESHKSHLLSSSDRCVRNPKSLRAIRANGQESRVELCQPAAHKR